MPIDPRNTSDTNSQVDGPFLNNPEKSPYSSTTEDLLDRILTAVSPAPITPPAPNYFPIEMIDLGATFMPQKGDYNKFNFVDNGIYYYLDFTSGGSSNPASWIDNLYTSYNAAATIWTFSITDWNTGTVYEFHVDKSTMVLNSYSAGTQIVFLYSNPSNTNTQVQNDWANFPNQPYFNNSTPWVQTPSNNINDATCFIRWHEFNATNNFIDTLDDGITPYTPSSNIDSKLCILAKLTADIKAILQIPAPPLTFEYLTTGTPYCDNGVLIYLHFIYNEIGTITSKWTDETGTIITPTGSQKIGACSVDSNCIAQTILTFTTTAIALPSIPSTAKRAVIVLEANATSTITIRQARFRENGINPTLTQGMPLNDNTEYEITSRADLLNFRIIGIEAGKNHVLQIQYFD